MESNLAVCHLRKIGRIEGRCLLITGKSDTVSEETRSRSFLSPLNGKQKRVHKEE